MSEKEKRGKHEVTEKDIESRRDAVKRIARRAGYPEYRAEEIAQDAALQLMEKPGRKTQTNHQAYVDVLRRSIERTYTRTGRLVRPLFESQFENYSDFINGIGCEHDFERIEEDRGDILDLVTALTKIKRDYQIDWILYFYYGWTMDDISKQRGVHASTISQRLAFSKEQVKEKVVSARRTQEKKRRREREKSQALSRKIQERPELSEKEKRILEMKSSKKSKENSSMRATP